MSSFEVRSDIRQTIKAAIAAKTISAVFLETINIRQNKKNLPDEWITLAFYGDGEEQVSLAAGDDKRMFRERGTVQAHCFALSGKGDERGVKIADEVRAVLRAKRLPGGTVIETVDPPATEDGDDIGRYFRTSVEISYRIEHII